MHQHPHPLRRVRALDRLSEHDLCDLAAQTSVEIYPPHHTIIEQGQIDSTLYFLVRGYVNVLLPTPEGEVFLTMLYPGEYFGEAGLFSDLPRSATVRSVGEVEVYSLSRESFEALMEHSPALVADMLHGMFREHTARLHRTSSEMVSRKTFFSRFVVNGIST